MAHEVERYGVPRPAVVSVDGTGGKAREASRASNPEVIYVQDAHAVYEAQTNIARLITYFANEMPQPANGRRVVVALEGAHGLLELGSLTEGTRHVRQRIARHYLRRGLLSGAEYAALRHPESIELRGIEDRSTYLRNRRHFLKAYTRQEHALHLIVRQRAALERKKAAAWHPDLLMLDRKKRQFQQETIGLWEYLDFLMAQAARKKTVCPSCLKRRFRHLEQLIRIRELEKDWDTKALEQEAEALLQGIRAKTGRSLSPRFLADWLEAERNGDTLDLAGHLVALAREEGLPVPSNGPIARYAKYLRQSRKLSSPELFDELNDLASALKEDSYRSDEERSLDEEGRLLDALEKLAHLEATRIQAEAVLRAKRKGRLSPELARLLHFHFKFYQCAIDRDRILFRNLRSLLSERPPLLILVAGGFHTRGLRRLLRRHRISYRILAPRFGRKQQGSSYADLMQGRISPVEEIGKIFRNDAGAALGDENRKQIRLRDGREVFYRFWLNEKALTVDSQAHGNPELITVETSSTPFRASLRSVPTGLLRKSRISRNFGRTLNEAVGQKDYKTFKTLLERRLREGSRSPSARPVSNPLADVAIRAAYEALVRDHGTRDEFFEEFSTRERRAFLDYFEEKENKLFSRRLHLLRARKGRFKEGLSRLPILQSGEKETLRAISDLMERIRRESLALEAFFASPARRFEFQIAERKLEERSLRRTRAPYTALAASLGASPGEEEKDDPMFFQRLVEDFQQNFEAFNAGRMEETEFHAYLSILSSSAPLASILRIVSQLRTVLAYEVEMSERTGGEVPYLPDVGFGLHYHAEKARRLDQAESEILLMSRDPQAGILAIGAARRRADARFGQIDHQPQELESETMRAAALNRLVGLLQAYHEIVSKPNRVARYQGRSLLDPQLRSMVLQMDLLGSLMTQEIGSEELLRDDWITFERDKRERFLHILEESHFSVLVVQRLFLEIPSSHWPLAQRILEQAQASEIHRHDELNEILPYVLPFALPAAAGRSTSDLIERTDGLEALYAALYRGEIVPSFKLVREEPGWYTPEGIFVPARIREVAYALSRAGLAPGQKFADLGSGDGRVVQVAASIFGADATGYETSTELHRVAEAVKVWIEHHPDDWPGYDPERVRFTHKDFMQEDWSQYDVIFYFDRGANAQETPQFYEKLKTLKPGAILVVYREVTIGQGDVLSFLEHVETIRFTERTGATQIYRMPGRQKAASLGQEWDEGQRQALSLGINPALVAPGLKFDELGEGLSTSLSREAKIQWWIQNHFRGNKITNRGVREMIEQGETRLGDSYRTYFVGPVPDDPDNPWYTAHQILHDIFLTSLTQEERREFYEIVTREKKAPFVPRGYPSILYFLWHDDLVSRMGSDPLKSFEGLIHLSEIFARLGTHYLGMPYPPDRNHYYFHEPAFRPFFQKIRLKAAALGDKTATEALKALPQASRKAGPVGQSLGAQDPLAGVPPEIAPELRAWNGRYARNSHNLSFQKRDINMVDGMGSVAEFDFLKQLIRFLGDETKPVLTQDHWVSSPHEFQEMVSYLERKGYLLPNEREGLAATYAFLDTVSQVAYGMGLRESVEVQHMEAFLNELAQVRQEDPVAENNLEERRSAFYREFHEHAATAFHAVTRLVLALYGERYPPTYGDLEALDEHFMIRKRTGLRFSLKRGFVVEEISEIHLRDGIDPDSFYQFVPGDQASDHHHPELTFRVFEHAAARELPPSQEILTALRKNAAGFAQFLAHERQAPGSSRFAQLNGSFLNILRTPRDISYTLWPLHHLKLLDAYIPHYARVRSLFTELTHHRFSVDQHTLYNIELMEGFAESREPAFEKAREVYLKIHANPDQAMILRLGMLFHDIGKGLYSPFGPGHAVTAAQDIVPAVLTEMGLRPDQIREVAWLVRNHMVLSAAADRVKDHPPEIHQRTLELLADPGMNQFLFNSLFVLSFADRFGVDPNQREKLLWEGKGSSLTAMKDLFETVSEVLKHPTGDRGRLIQEKIQEMKAVESEEAVRLEKETAAYLAQPGVLEREIRLYLERDVDYPDLKTAEIVTKIREGLSAENFSPLFRTYVTLLPVGYIQMLPVGSPEQASALPQSPLDDSRVRQLIFLRHLEVLKQLKIKASLALISPFHYQHERFYQVMIGVTDDEPGVLAKLTGVLTANGVDVHGAEIGTTSSGLGLNRFFGFLGHPVEDFEMLRRRLGADLMDVIAQGLSIPSLFELRGKPYRFDKKVAGALDQPPRLEFEGHVQVGEAGASVLNLETIDRVGLLHLVSEALHQRFGVNIVRVSVATYHYLAADKFFINKEGKPLAAVEEHAIAEYLVDLLSQPVVYGASLGDEREPFTDFLMDLMDRMDPVIVAKGNKTLLPKLAEFLALKGYLTFRQIETAQSILIGEAIGSRFYDFADIEVPDDASLVSWSKFILRELERRGASRIRASAKQIETLRGAIRQYEEPRRPGRGHVHYQTRETARGILRTLFTASAARNAKAFIKASAAHFERRLQSDDELESALKQFIRQANDRVIHPNQWEYEQIQDHHLSFAPRGELPPLKRSQAVELLTRIYRRYVAHRMLSQINLLPAQDLVLGDFRIQGGASLGSFRRLSAADRIMADGLEQVLDDLNPVRELGQNTEVGTFFPSSLGEALEIFRILKSHDPEIEGLLDVGSGDGGAAVLGKKMGFRVTAIEFEPELMGIARAFEERVGTSQSESPVEWIQGNFFEAVIPWEKISIVFYADRGFPPRQEIKLFQTIREKARPGTVLVIYRQYAKTPEEMRESFGFRKIRRWNFPSVLEGRALPSFAYEVHTVPAARLVKNASSLGRQPSGLQDFSGSAEKLQGVLDNIFGKPEDEPWLYQGKVRTYKILSTPWYYRVGDLFYLPYPDFLFKKHLAQRNERIPTAGDAYYLKASKFQELLKTLAPYRSNVVFARLVTRSSEPDLDFRSSNVNLNVILSLMETRDLYYGLRALDAGSGAGILAFTLARPGAREVVGSDNQSDTIALGRRMARLNGLTEDKVRFGVADLRKTSEKKLGQFDYIVANLADWGMVKVDPKHVESLHSIVIQKFPSAKHYLVAGDRIGHPLAELLQSVLHHHFESVEIPVRLPEGKKTDLVNFLGRGRKSSAAGVQHKGHRPRGASLGDLEQRPQIQRPERERLREELFAVMNVRLNRMLETHRSRGFFGWQRSVDLDAISMILWQVREADRRFASFDESQQGFLYEIASRLTLPLGWSLRVKLWIARRIFSSLSIPLLWHFHSEEDVYFEQYAIGQLARKMEMASPTESQRIERFLREYLARVSQENDPEILRGFVDYLLKNYLQRGYKVIFIGRGTEQVEWWTRKETDRRGIDSGDRIKTAYISRQMLGESTDEELRSYLDQLGVLGSERVVFVDTGYRIAHRFRKIAEREGTPAKTFFLALNQFAYRPLEAAKRGELDYAEVLLGLPEGKKRRSREVHEIRARIPGLIFFVDKLLGKSFEPVGAFQDSRPLLVPTSTPRFHRLSNEVFEAWMSSRAGSRAVAASLGDDNSTEKLPVVEKPLAQIPQAEIRNIFVFAGWHKIIAPKLGEAMIDQFPLVTALRRQFPAAAIHLSSFYPQIFSSAGFHDYVKPLDPSLVDLFAHRPGEPELSSARASEFKKFLVENQIDLVVDLTPFTLSRSYMDRAPEEGKFSRPYLASVQSPTVLASVFDSEAGKVIERPLFQDRQGRMYAIAGFDEVDAQAFPPHGIWNYVLRLQQLFGLDIDENTLGTITLTADENGAAISLLDAWYRETHGPNPSLPFDPAKKVVVVNTDVVTHMALLDYEGWLNLIENVMRGIPDAYFVFPRSGHMDKVMGLVKNRPAIDRRRIIFSGRDIYPDSHLLFGLAEKTHGGVISPETGFSHLAAAYMSGKRLGVVTRSNLLHWLPPSDRVIPFDVMTSLNDAVKDFVSAVNSGPAEAHADGSSLGDLPRKAAPYEITFEPWDWELDRGLSFDKKEIEEALLDVLFEKNFVARTLAELFQRPVSVEEVKRVTVKQLQEGRVEGEGIFRAEVALANGNKGKFVLVVPKSVRRNRSVAMIFESLNLLYSLDAQYVGKPFVLGQGRYLDRELDRSGQLTIFSMEYLKDYQEVTVQGEREMVINPYPKPAKGIGERRSADIRRFMIKILTLYYEKNERRAIDGLSLKAGDFMKHKRVLDLKLITARGFRPRTVPEFIRDLIDHVEGGPPYRMFDAQEVFAGIRDGLVEVHGKKRGGEIAGEWLKGFEGEGHSLGEQESSADSRVPEISVLHPQEAPKNAVLAVLAFVVGFFSASLGIGGGAIMMPVLLLLRQSMKKATPASGSSSHPGQAPDVGAKYEGKKPAGQSLGDVIQVFDPERHLHPAAAIDMAEILHRSISTLGREKTLEELDRLTEQYIADLRLSHSVSFRHKLSRLERELDEAFSKIRTILLERDRAPERVLSLGTKLRRALNALPSGDLKRHVYRIAELLEVLRAEIQSGDVGLSLEPPVSLADGELEHLVQEADGERERSFFAGAFSRRSPDDHRAVLVTVSDPSLPNSLLRPEYKTILRAFLDRNRFVALRILHVGDEETVARLRQEFATYGNRVVIEGERELSHAGYRLAEMVQSLLTRELNSVKKILGLARLNQSQLRERVAVIAAKEILDPFSRNAFPVREWQSVLGAESVLGAGSGTQQGAHLYDMQSALSIAGKTTEAIRRQYPEEELAIRGQRFIPNPSHVAGFLAVLGEAWQGRRQVLHAA